MAAELRALIKADPALVNAKGGDGKRPLHYARTIEIARFLLDRGAHRAALRAATGPLLPGSSAPGVESLRGDLARHLGESLRTSGSVDVLLQWVGTAQGADDEQARRELLRLLPPRSPRRAGLVAGAVGGPAAGRDAQRDATSADLP